MLRRRDFMLNAALAGAVPYSAAEGPARGQVKAGVDAAQGASSPAGILPTPIDYGARGDGVTDDSAAFNRALAGNLVVYVPPRRYAVANVVVNRGNALIGHIGGPLYSNDPAAAKPALLALSGASHVLDVHNAHDFTIEGLMIDGLNNGPNGISDGGMFGTLRNLTVVNCHYGLGGRLSNGYSSVLRITDCEFGQCRIGLTNLNDSTVANSAVSTNYGAGIYMGDGSGATNFIALRSEWNAGYGVELYKAVDVQFLGGMFDRNSHAAVFANGCNGLSFTGVLFRRNAANNARPSAGAIADSHVYLQNCSSALLTGCRTRSGAGDGGIGAVTPRYAIRFGSGNTDVSVAGCDLSGRTAAAFSGTLPMSVAQLNVGT